MNSDLLYWLAVAAFVTFTVIGLASKLGAAPRCGNAWRIGNYCLPLGFALLSAQKGLFEANVESAIVLGVCAAGIFVAQFLRRQQTPLSD